VDFPEVTFIFIDSKEQLLGINDETFHNSRLIAFFTDIVIPKAILDKVSFGCYNFHPSTPNRRGWRSEAIGQRGPDRKRLHVIF
jgi:hypothetical protein